MWVSPSQIDQGLGINRAKSRLSQGKESTTVIQQSKRLTDSDCALQNLYTHIHSLYALYCLSVSPLSLASVQGTLNTFELKLICRDDERKQTVVGQNAG